MIFFRLILVIFLVLTSQISYAISVIRDAESEDIILKIATPIFNVSNLKHNIKIVIFNDPKINAFVMDGKSIYVSTGLISFSTDPGAIAGVIAHECGHMKDGHIIKTQDKAKDLTKATLISTLVGIAAIAGKGGDAGAATIVGANEIATRNMIGFIKTNEYAADVASYSTLKKLNIPSDTFTRLIQEIGKVYKAQGYGKKSSTYSTHPSAHERKDFIDRHQTFDPQKPNGIPNSLRDKFAMVSAKIFAFTNSPSATLAKFPGNKDYEMYARAIGLYKSHKFDEAISNLDKLISKDLNNGYLYETKGQFFFEKRRIGESIELLETANKLVENSLIKLELATSLCYSKNLSDMIRAITLLKSAADIDPLNHLIWRQLSIAYGKVQDNFAYQVALAKESDLLGDKQYTKNFISKAKAYLKYSKSSDRFISQTYQDLLNKLKEDED